MSFLVLCTYVSSKQPDQLYPTHPSLVMAAPVLSCDGDFPPADKQSFSSLNVTPQKLWSGFLPPGENTMIHEDHQYKCFRASQLFKCDRKG